MDNTKGSYVAVTGCTDGIGKALTVEFAKRGYGAYLLSRNFEKLDDLRNTLKDINPNKELHPKILKIDFAKAGK